MLLYKLELHNLVDRVRRSISWSISWDITLYMYIVRQISYKIVHFNDKSTKFGTDVEDHLTNKYGYWASADHPPIDRFQPLNCSNNILMFNYTINKKKLQTKHESLYHMIQNYTNLPIWYSIHDQNALCV